MSDQPAPFFNRGPSLFVRVLLFIVLSLLLLLTDTRYKVLEATRQTLSLGIYPLQRLALVPGQVTTRVSDFLVAQVQLTRDNAELKTRVLGNAAQLQRYQTLVSENMHLRSLLAAREKHQGTAIMAEILYSGRDPFSQKIVIDKGAQQQVKNGQAVIDERGVVGQITRVYPLVSDVTLLTDKDQAVPVQVARTGLRAILFGYGRGNPPELRFIPINADIQPGDELVTSGIDGTYPTGLPVAVVKSIDRNAALAFAKVSCAPSAGIDHSRHLLVLTEISNAPAKPEPDETPEAVASGKSKKSRKRN